MIGSTFCFLELVLLQFFQKITLLAVLLHRTRAQKAWQCRPFAFAILFRARSNIIAAYRCANKFEQHILCDIFDLDILIFKAKESGVIVIIRKKNWVESKKLIFTRSKCRIMQKCRFGCHTQFLHASGANVAAQMPP